MEIIASQQRSEKKKPTVQEKKVKIEKVPNSETEIAAADIFVMLNSTRAVCVCESQKVSPHFHTWLFFSNITTSSLLLLSIWCGDAIYCKTLLTKNVTSINKKPFFSSSSIVSSKPSKSLHWKILYQQTKKLKRKWRDRRSRRASHTLKKIYVDKSKGIKW